MGKHDVKPFIEVEMKDLIYKLSFITGFSVNNICEDLCTHAIKTGVGKELSSHFKREIKLDGVVYPSLKEPKKFAKNTNKIERMSLKLSSFVYEYANTLSFAMGGSISKVVAYFLERSVNDYDFLDQYTTEFLSKKMDENRKNIMKKIIYDVNNDYLPDDSKEHSIISLLIYIIDEYKQPTESVEEALKNFI